MDVKIPELNNMEFRVRFSRTFVALEKNKSGYRFLDMMNLMALPLILGIGIDDGVHVIHRWRLEGPRSAYIVLSSTGKAVLLTSLTTMLAFGSMMFSPFRGYASLSYALIFGVGACFLTTAIIVPAIMGLVDRQKDN